MRCHWLEDKGWIYTPSWLRVLSSARSPAEWLFLCTRGMNVLELRRQQPAIGRDGIRAGVNGGRTIAEVKIEGISIYELRVTDEIVLY